MNIRTMGGDVDGMSSVFSSTWSFDSQATQSLPQLISDCVVPTASPTAERDPTWPHDEDEDDGHVPGMCEVDDRRTSITNLVYLKETPVFTSVTVPVQDDCIIPRDPFEDADPDDHEYEGYMGNVSYRTLCRPLTYC